MRILSLASCFVLLSAPASATHIGIFTDPGTLKCHLVSAGGGTLHTIYVIALQSSGTVSAAFKVEAALPPGVVPIGGSPVIGLCEFSCDPYAGVAASRECSTDDWPMWTLSFLSYLPPDGITCNHLTITNALVLDCAYNELPATGGSFSFVTAPGQCEACALATEATTWGSVKALYR